MTTWPFAVQLAIAVLLFLVVAATTLRFLLVSGRTTAAPMIRASFKPLQQGWYQLDLKVANRVPYGFRAISLSRVRPRSARLMAPISSVTTRKGNVQILSDPAVDDPVPKIALDLAIGPHEPAYPTISLGSEAEATAWLFLEDDELDEVTLELVLRDSANNRRRCRFTATRA
jgi:hypothetical protein